MVRGARESNGAPKRTYSVTQWSRIPLEKLTGLQPVKKFSAFYANPKVYYSIHKCPPPVPILSQLDPVHTPTCYFLKIHINIIFPSMPWSSKFYLSFRFPHQNPLYKSLYLYFCVSETYSNSP